tara:strand:- start:215 stop:445 length:231 start_codon:yes stop_codon:yes gene_type:complete
MRKLLKEWRSYLNEEMTDQEKLALGNKLIQLRLPSDKDYHFPSLNDFFRIVKDVEKFPQSEDELYDAYMFAKRNNK